MHRVLAIVAGALRTFFRERGVDSIAMLKIDVEGAEYSVIEGARETIIRDRPTLIFEHTAGGADHFGVTPGKLHDLVVEELGMRIYDITGEGPYDRARFESVFEDPLWVFVARP